MPCSEIIKRTKVIDIIEHILNEKLAVHITRMEVNRWSKRGVKSDNPEKGCCCWLAA